MKKEKLNEKLSLYGKVTLNDEYEARQIHNRQSINKSINYIRVNVLNAKTILKYNYNKALYDKYVSLLSPLRVKRKPILFSIRMYFVHL